MLSWRDGDTFPSTGGETELGGQSSALMGQFGSLLLRPGSFWGTESGGVSAQLVSQSCFCPLYLTLEELGELGCLAQPAAPPQLRAFPRGSTKTLPSAMSGPALPQPREMCTAQLERRVTEALKYRESHGGQTGGGVETR